MTKNTIPHLHPWRTLGSFLLSVFQIQHMRLIELKNVQKSSSVRSILTFSSLVHVSFLKHEITNGFYGQPQYKLGKRTKTRKWHEAEILHNLHEYEVPTYYCFLQQIEFFFRKWQAAKSKKLSHKNDVQESESFSRLHHSQTMNHWSSKTPLLVLSYYLASSTTCE